MVRTQSGHLGWDATLIYEFTFENMFENKCKWYGNFLESFQKIQKIVDRISEMRTIQPKIPGGKSIGPEIPSQKSRFETFGIHREVVFFGKIVPFTTRNFKISPATLPSPLPSITRFLILIPRLLDREGGFI